MAEFDDLDSLDDLGDLEQISFDGTNPILEGATPGAPQPMAAAPMGGLAAVIYDLISRRNYQQVIQIAESQKNAIEQDPKLKALVDNAKAQLQQEAQLKSYLEGARQAIDAGQNDQAQAFLAKAREIDPGHPDLQAFAASQPQPAAPTQGEDPFALPASDSDPFALPAPGAPDPFAMPAPGAPMPMAAPPGAPQPGAPQPAAPQPAAPQPDLLSFDDPRPLPDLDFPDPLAAPGAPQPGAPQPGAPQPAAPQPAAPDAFAMPAPGAPAPAAPDAFAMPGAPAPAAPDAFAMPAPGAPQPAAPQPAAPQPAAPGDDFGDLSLDPAGLPEGFEPAGLAPAPPNPMAAPEGGDKIPELIAEGKAHFEQGQYQAAIDTWSRIFLIDIDHAEASRLIEQAQNKKAELERQAEEIFHGALEQIEQQQLEEAKVSLARVLELQPTHTTAKEYLDQLNAGQVPVVAPTSGTGEIDLLDDGGLGAFDGTDLAAASGIDTGQTMEAAVARDRVVVVKKTDRKLVGIAAGVGLLVLGGGGFLALKWNDLFPNTAKPAPAKRQLDPIERATKMFEAGKIENAVLLLEKISSEEEDFEEAQALIAQWKTQIEAAAQPTDAGPAPEMVARRNLLLRAARDAYGQDQFIRARKYFERANKISPLESDDLSMLRDSNFKLEPLEPHITKFSEGEYKQAITELWKLFDKSPDDPNIKLLLVDSYYNLSLTDLQRGNTASAAEKLTEALEVDPGNPELTRMKLFAETYSKKSQDLLYRIYVKYLPSRS